MSAVLGLLLLALQDRGSEPLFKQLGVSPTGKNGYEEYCRAGELTRGTKLAELMRKAADEPSLATRSALVEGSAPIFELIRTGNAKPSFPLREQVDTNSLFPELALFKNIAKIYASRIYVSLARGNSDGAAVALAEGLTFSDRIAHQTLINYLVRNANTSILLGELSPRFVVFSVSACEKIISYVDRFFAQPEPLAKCLSGEMAYLAEMRGLTQEDRNQLLSEDQYAEIRALDDGSWKRLIAQTAERANRMMSDFVGSLNRHEALWKAPEIPEEPASLVDVMLANWFPALDQVLASAHKVRTQLRLLRLHAEIEKFRWNTMRLPQNLKELGPEATTDPLTGGSFQYSVTGTAYEVFSLGTKKTGPIHLRYQRPPSEGSDPVPPSAYN